jgi:hypothetical protein
MALGKQKNIIARSANDNVQMTLDYLLSGAPKKKCTSVQNIRKNY